MGGVIGVKDPYEYSNSVEVEDLEKKSDKRQPKLSNVSPREKVEKARMHTLEVPQIDRHPFQEYRFSKKLGEGSFSVVYKGLDVNEDSRKVAIKEIDLKKLNKQQLSDLNVEMNILSQLHHDSIVRLDAVYSLPDKKFMVMEYLKGGDLLNAVCRRDFYTEGDARALMLQITSALHYMHERAVIHRDIKPENLILADKSLDSPIKLVDFGFATIESEQTKKPSRYLCGTPGYMAPEVLRERSYSTKVDIWALGVVFYILLSGLMPFSTEAADEVDVLNGNFGFPSERFSTVSALAKDLISKMLVVDISHRLSAREVLDHPWMKLPIKRSSDLAEESSHVEEPSASHIDADISSNLEALRQHNATRKFNLTAMVLHGLSSLRSNASSRSTLLGNSPQNTSHKTRRASDPALLARSIANDAKQAEKLARLSAAIASHNHSAANQQLFQQQPSSATSTPMQSPAPVQKKSIQEQRRHSVL